MNPFSDFCGSQKQKISKEKVHDFFKTGENMEIDYSSQKRE